MKTVHAQKQNTGYFTLNQCIYSSTAHKNKIDNFPGSDYSLEDPNLNKDNIILNLHKLFKYCINPIFRKFNSNKLALTSVYRNKEVNKLLKGVKNSQHIYGYAADIVLKDGTNSSELFNWCRINIPQYHQLIWEYPEKGGYKEGYNNLPEYSWIHISYIKGSNFKTNSVSSNMLNLHKKYEDENTYSIGNFTHRIKEANQDYLIELK